MTLMSSFFVESVQWSMYTDCYDVPHTVCQRHVAVFVITAILTQDDTMATPMNGHKKYGAVLMYSEGFDLGSRVARSRGHLIGTRHVRTCRARTFIRAWYI